MLQILASNNTNCEICAESRFLPVDGPQGPERASRNSESLLYTRET